jgi:hypothetical protein
MREEVSNWCDILVPLSFLSHSFNAQRSNGEIVLIKPDSLSSTVDPVLPRRKSALPSLTVSLR